jgi:hypothetical protein
MRRSVFGAIPNHGMRKKKIAAKITLNVCATKRVIENARRAKITERVS